MKEINKIISIRKEYFKIWGILEECYRFYGDIYEGDNADEENLKKLRAFIDTLDNVEKIEVLPYHTMGKSKYEKLNIAYPLDGVDVPTKDQVELANKILKGEK